jgi:hypothetical protein
MDAWTASDAGYVTIPISDQKYEAYMAKALAPAELPNPIL